MQDYLTDPARMKRFYAAIRGKITTPGPARPVFRSNADMMLLTTRLRIDPDGKPHIPGGLSLAGASSRNIRSGKYDAQTQHAPPPAGKIPTTFSKPSSRSAASRSITSRSRSSWR